MSLNFKKHTFLTKFEINIKKNDSEKASENYGMDIII